jgi:glutamate/tyrosine decarboxylase-like PLP-dependent enzyme
MFLGPYGENDEVFEKLLVEFLRDHVYWRRNFHPEDPPAIPTLAANRADYAEFIARMKQSLHRLSAKLKHSVPFSSPRYIGHMASDPLLPALLAQMITLPYNPNNVVQDAAPVTVELELEVGLQIARMLGYEVDESRPDCPFGHLTSGGTVANFESIWVARAMKYYPVAIASVPEFGEAITLPGMNGPIGELSDRELANLSYAEVLTLREAVIAHIAEVGPQEGKRLADALDHERTEYKGAFEFHRCHPTLAPPRVLIPHTAHYSWSKGMKLTGLGRDQLVKIAEEGMRMRADALEEELAALAAAEQDVLLVVGVLGTTEFGTIDPIDEIIAARERWRTRGLSFGVHVDAAWGGYLASMFRDRDGGWLSREQVNVGHDRFPSEAVHRAFVSLGKADSVTVDPHKLGYVPYGSGAFVCRDQRMMDLVTQDAAYTFDAAASGLDPSDRSRYLALGHYILEGSKSGAAAAGVYVTHEVIPLHAEGMGRLMHHTIRSSERFYDRLLQLSDELDGEARITVPVMPDTNLVCVVINPWGNHDLATCNAFGRRVFEHLRVDKARPVQMKEFFGSYTSIDPAALGEEETATLLGKLDLAPDCMGKSNDALFVIRHTLMSPFLEDPLNGVDYLERYCAYLVSVIREELAADRSA